MTNSWRALAKFIFYWVLSPSVFSLALKTDEKERGFNSMIEKISTKERVFFVFPKNFC